MKFNIYDKKNQRVIILVVAAVLILAMLASVIAYIIY